MIHNLICTERFDNGSLELFCPECKRKFILHLDAVREVLEEGDDSVQHVYTEFITFSYVFAANSLPENIENQIDEILKKAEDE